MKVRKIRAEMTKEMVEDLSKIHGIDIVAQIENQLVRSYQLTIKTRKEKIEELLNGKK